MSEATSKGHLTQERQNFRSTKRNIVMINKNNGADDTHHLNQQITNQNDTFNANSPEAYVSIDDPRHPSTAHSDQTGTFLYDQIEE